MLFLVGLAVGVFLRALCVSVCVCILCCSCLCYMCLCFALMGVAIMC